MTRYQIFLQVLLLLALPVNSVMAQSYQYWPKELLPRSLDQDPSTIEGYYDVENDVTWVANGNLAKTERFGIPEADIIECNSDPACTGSVPGIDSNGLMEWPTADNYIVAMNANNYLGYSSWRLPTTTWVERTYPEYSYYTGAELPNILGSIYDIILQETPSNWAQYITGSLGGRYGGRSFWRGSDTSLGREPSVDGLTRFAVWPLLDGDQGTAVQVQPTCLDSDGDGYGWNGESTCVAETFTANNFQPRDLNLDGVTIDAYYDPKQNVTWLANNRLAQTETFGLRERLDEACATGGNCRTNIYSNGTMSHADLAQAWFKAMNDSAYLGYNQWRPPAEESSLAGLEHGSELSILLQSIKNDDVPVSAEEFFPTEYYFFSADGRIESTDREQVTVSSYDSWRYIWSVDVGYNFTYGSIAWPLHDGDIGVPIEGPSAACVDTDGDGWGWNGVESCAIQNAVPVLTNCIDTDGDGWGWDGVTSCRP